MHMWQLGSSSDLRVRAILILYLHVFILDAMGCVRTFFGEFGGRGWGRDTKSVRGIASSSDFDHNRDHTVNDTLPTRASSFRLNGL
ncbi:hypothetical protein EDB92DRAFT_1846289 [Lactarius akahatsu]|uniref:Uncharacterized protein n=1 Tax=Lactarius akahatsu TaxID=416441 RepID=A0AAD4QCM5_9AGAM|nr:hypothetical protein EDB92DRAFT_1846289 [Lactarius akahatsu]